MITAESSSRPKPELAACRNIWCAVLASGNGNLLARARIEHQAEILDEDIHRRKRSVIAGQHMGHPVLEHPAIACAVRNHIVERSRVNALAQAQGHRFRGGRDMNPGQKLVDDLDLAAIPGRRPKPIYLSCHGIQCAAHLGIGIRMPDVIMVISPLAALAAPPEIGASRYRMPFSARRFSSAIDQPGSTVEHITKTLPGLHGCGRTTFAKQDRLRLRRVDHHADHHFASRRHLSRAAASHAALCGKRLRYLAANVEHMDTVTCSPQRLGHAHPHGAQPNQSNIASHSFAFSFTCSTACMAVKSSAGALPEIFSTSETIPATTRLSASAGKAAYTP